MIHDDHPFQTPPDERDPVRQFRGRLVAPVTVFTAGGEGSWAGLTVSSLMIAEGEEASVVALIGPATDLWDQIEATQTFIVHILDDSQREHGDRRAARRTARLQAGQRLVLRRRAAHPVAADDSSHARFERSTSEKSVFSADWRSVASDLLLFGNSACVCVVAAPFCLPAAMDCKFLLETKVLSRSGQGSR